MPLRLLTKDAGKDTTMHHVYALTLYVYTDCLHFHQHGLLIACCSPQSAGPTQAVKGAVGGENPGLAPGARSDAKVSEGWVA